MSRAKAKINAADKATDAILDAIATGERALQRFVRINGYGVLSDRSMVSSQLWEAKEAIDKAVKILRETQWPTEADYREVD